MNINQVYEIVNKTADQSMGTRDVQVTDVSSLVSLGNDVMSSETSKDNFLNTLVDRIGKTIISQRAYSAGVSALINDAFTFGAILQKVYVAPVKATTSSQWDLINGTAVDQYVIAKPTVKQKLFNKRSTWEVDITIPDIQLNSAFRSAEEMATFIDAIFLAIRNSQEIYLAGMSEMCYANMIGEQCVYTEGGGASVIDLLANYNKLMATTLTTDQAMHNTDFLKYASMTINLFVKKLAKMSTLYNTEGYARFTDAANLRVTMLADFTSACTSYLQANTYHDELVALPKYSEITYWQGTGRTPNFASASKVAVVTASGHTVVQDNVVCLMTDDEAIGLTYDNRRSKSAYNSKGEYTNFFEKADMGYFNDLSENCIVFTVGSVSPVTTSAITPINTEYDSGAGGDVALTVTLATGETISAVNVNGSALTSGTDYSVSGNTLTVKSAYLSGKTGTITFDIELSTNALLEFYITIA